MSVEAIAFLCKVCGKLFLNNGKHGNIGIFEETELAQICLHQSAAEVTPASEGTRDAIQL